MERARFIVETTPDIGRRAIWIRKLAHVGAVVCFFLISVLLVMVHPAILIFVWIVGFIVLDFDFGKYERNARELKWAKTVLGDVERAGGVDGIADEY